jgi:hypothetical protein
VLSGVAAASPIGTEATVGSAVEIVVHARAPGRRGEPLADALPTIEEWQAERRLDASGRVASRRLGWRR